MYSLKPLTREAVPRALEKAERYRLLNEPAEAESICADVLAADPENQEALVTLLLALTDRFAEGGGEVLARARGVLPRLASAYERAYFAGLICERHAKAQLERGAPGAAAIAWHGLVEAMELYEKAEAIRPTGNDDALLRWNTCVRILESHPQAAPALDEHPEPLLLE